MLPVVGFLDSYWPYIVPGMVSGSVYALLASGLVLTYRTTGVLNLAFAGQAYASAVVYYDLRVDGGWPSIPALVVAALVAAPILGYALDRLVFRFLRGQSVVTRLAVSIGMLVAIPAIAQILTGGIKDRTSTPPVWKPLEFYQWGPINIDSDQVAVIVVSAVVLTFLGLYMTFSNTGLRMRAVVESRHLSELHGVGATGVSTAAWLISSVLAGLAGVMLAPLFPQLRSVNYLLLLMAALAAAVFGRMSSIVLTVLGGFLTGIGENIIIKWFSVSGNLASSLRPSFPFLFLFALLLVYRSLGESTRSDPMSGVDPPETALRSALAPLPGTRLQRGALGAAALVVVFVFTNNLWAGVFAEAALMGIVFLSMMLLTGQAGHISLCHAAFVGNGAWVTARLALDHGWPILLAALGGAIVAGASGLVLAIPSLRLGELPMALATFGFGILSSNLIFNQDWTFGTGSGLFLHRPSLGPLDFDDNKPFLALALVALLMTILLVRVLLRGTTGQFLAALRGSPTAAASVGINGIAPRVAVFALSAGLAGFAGGLMASMGGILTVQTYSVGTSLYWLVVVLVIGVHSVRSAVAGGFVIALLPQLINELPENLALLQFILFGLGVVGLARHPEGAFEYFVNLPEQMKQRTRMLSGSATADEHRAALVALEARPLPADDPESDLHLLPSTPEERAERRARRRSLMIEALKLRARMKIYPIRLLYIMTLAFSIDAMARSMLGIVLDDVRRDFGVGDFDMSALNAGYAIVAGISVIPFGILSDRWNRKNLIALGFIPWGLAMMWQSVAGTFAMMFIARLFLGSIEGTNGPSTPSILGDYYPVRRRNRVFGIFATGTSLGSTLGFMFGGAMAQGMGWRGSFFAFGVIGLFAALILFRSLEEPDRGLQDALYRLETEIDRLDRIEDLEAEALARPDVAEVILQAHPNNVETRAAPDGGGSEPAEDGGVDYRDLSLVEGALAAVKNRTFALLLAGQVATDFFIGLLGLFAITFFRRYHGLSVASASGVVALLSIAVIIGTVHAGHIGDRLVARGTPGGRVQLTWLTRVVTFFAISLAWATPNLALAAPGFLLTGYLLGIANPLTAAVTVDIVVARLRGQSQGLLAAVRAGSTALGPLALGFLSDRYGLRQGTLFLAPILLVSAVITWLAGRFYDNDQEKARVESLRQYALEEADPRDEISPGESAPEDLASL